MESNLNRINKPAKIELIPCLRLHLPPMIFYVLVFPSIWLTHIFRLIFFNLLFPFSPPPLPAMTRDYFSGSFYFESHDGTV